MWILLQKLLKLGGKILGRSSRDLLSEVPILKKPGEPFVDGQHLWAAIKPSGNFLHTGLIFRDDDGILKIIHLAWHFDLCVAPDFGDYKFVEVNLDPISQEIIAGLAHKISVAKPRIAYAPDFAGLSYDAGTGELLGGTTGKGYTCATFLLSLFIQFGFRPLDLASWTPRPEDEVWKKEILAILRRHQSNSAHADAIEAAKYTVRYRPEEVVSALYLGEDVWPLNMLGVAKDSLQVKAEAAA